MNSFVLKLYLYKSKFILLILISCFMIFLVKPLSIHSPYKTEPLLLNAGLVQAQKAELSIILWIENGIIPNEVWTQLPMPDWVWSVKEQQTRQGNNVATLMGHRVIDKEEERRLYTWYTKTAPVLAKEGVQIYLDERVPEAIDISAHLSQTNTLPSQWSLLDNVVSIAGYQSNLGTSVMAGQDQINIQLLSRGSDTDGHTVLAIPALLKEF